MPTKKTPRERLDDAALRAAVEGRSVLEVALSHRRKGQAR
jgi:hypothetical protein